MANVVEYKPSQNIRKPPSDANEVVGLWSIMDLVDYETCNIEYDDDYECWLYTYSDSDGEIVARRYVTDDELSSCVCDVERFVLKYGDDFYE